MGSRLGGPDSLVSCTVSVSSVGGGGDEGRKKASKFNFPVRLLSVRLAVVGAEVGHGGVCTRRKDIHATGSQSCITTVPERS